MTYLVNNIYFWKFGKICFEFKNVFANGEPGERLIMNNVLLKYISSL